MIQHSTILIRVTLQRHMTVLYSGGILYVKAMIIIRIIIHTSEESSSKISDKLLWWNSGAWPKPISDGSCMKIGFWSSCYVRKNSIQFMHKRFIKIGLWTNMLVNDVSYDVLDQVSTKYNTHAIYFKLKCSDF